MLIDGTVNHFVSQITTLPILFACGYEAPIEFFVTRLDKSTPAVLGFSWLQALNPLINWKKKTISIGNHSTIPEPPTPKSSHPSPKLPAAINNLAPSEPPQLKGITTNKLPLISLINAVAFNYTCRDRGTIIYQLSPSNLPGPKGYAAVAGDCPNDLKNIPEEYLPFSDIFDKP